VYILRVVATVSLVAGVSNHGDLPLQGGRKVLAAETLAVQSEMVISTYFFEQESDFTNLAFRMSFLSPGRCIS
jgi:hypothetical protein